MRKGDDGEEKNGKKKKIMRKIVATNVVASRPPERRPTATPTARAKKMVDKSYIISCLGQQWWNAIFPPESNLITDNTRSHVQSPNYWS